MISSKISKEDKENENRDAWNQLDNIPEVQAEPAETKNQHMSFSQNFLQKRSMKEKQVTSGTQNSGARPPEKLVLGSYRGKVVSSKINSFRRKPENDIGKKPLADAQKSAVNGSNTVLKPVAVASLQNRPPVRVSVSHPKPILNREKQPINSVPVNKGTVQRKPGATGTPLLKTVQRKTFNSEPRTKETVPPKAVTRHGNSESKSVSVSKYVGNRRTQPVTAEMRRAQLAEWRASKGKGIKLPITVSADTQPKIVKLQQTVVKEPVKSFWAAIAEEDEQGLFRDTVDKTLRECLHSIKEGCPGDSIDSILEELISKFPDAKKFAKYWVCRMRIEQCRSTEKIIAIYEEAILAEAQPKNELRHALADIMKDTKDQPKSNGESVRKETVLNEKEEANSDEKIADSLKEIDMNKKIESGDEEASQKATEDKSQKIADVCLKSEQESCHNERKNRNNEENQNSTVGKKEEQCDGSADLDDIIETPERIPERDKEDSYLIKYNVSTTPYLESMKKKLQCDASDAVKDLKFLTPVRRSRRIQEKEYKLPKMLKDHDPCVTSLEQLGELGEETNVFIYRQNNALHKASDHLEGQCKE